MKPETQEWIEKAEGDLKVAQREIQAADPVYEAVCFHAQQGAEKYLKAVLEEYNLPFPKIHDLVAILGRGGQLLSTLMSEQQALARLSVFGIATRYPGLSADQKAAEESLKTAVLVRTVARKQLGLP